MAIKTGDIFNSLIFGGVNSADYGIYITGEAVYNAPVRAVEMVSVPGRNGAIALDQGRWENIEVTYPAGTFGDNQSDFRDSIKAFRNAIVSKLGYQRLTDTYNPNEYRMGLYMDGLEVAPVSQGKAGQFEIRFNCKPQRWLTSGEAKITLTSGDTVTNPTLYPASPIFEVKGYGTIEFNGRTIELEDGSYGDIELCPAGAYKRNRRTMSFNQELVFSSDLFDTGDQLTVGICSVPYLWFDGSDPAGITDTVISDPVFSEPLTQASPSIFTAGTHGHYSKTVTVTVNWTGEENGSPVSGASVYNVTLETRYTDTLRMYVIVTATQVSGDWALQIESWELDYGALTVKSNKTYLGDPTYIDCDLGECYAIENGAIIDLNAYIDLGSDLPVLAPGTNEITFDNTITELKMTPGWWQL